MPEKVGGEGKASSMSWVKSKKKEPINLDDFKDIDEDSVLQSLTEEEIKELDEAIDPEVSSRHATKLHELATVL